MGELIDTLSNYEKDVIGCFAAGQLRYRNEAISIYRTLLRVHGLRNGDPYMDFMSEIDNPVPDLALRSVYRRKVLASQKAPRND